MQSFGAQKPPSNACRPQRCVPVAVNPNSHSNSHMSPVIPTHSTGEFNIVLPMVQLCGNLFGRKPSGHSSQVPLTPARPGGHSSQNVWFVLGWYPSSHTSHAIFPSSIIKLDLYVPPWHTMQSAAPSRECGSVPAQACQSPALASLPMSECDSVPAGQGLHTSPLSLYVPLTQFSQSDCCKLGFLPRPHPMQIPWLE